ncbi:hypothetical protein Pmar_PMAR008223 [Perkinsus marinus ATCC 50983]|uniref:Uncharacterized protein n=1 Tax=Perkinsus marinus (strain ATCC 50983 / TXsc) TaxID=423536 RepID=C5LNM3_PERM5|nr:hypothetical protein Pmar_PMAR008223 [Perkinsus marinus ATCC 50983]EER01642.1 hypothetical protein Pmar_PMAR008223 [Perkinsus marinus ATCC 50983]|eukprot:XP_002768924.1 hypothetical protein Pmar_PMAR008223 [Perkinsus marinus ATCC 50983]
MHILNRGDPDIPVKARRSPAVEVLDLEPLPTLDYDSWRENLYVDHIRALDECVSLNSTWCIIFENDAMLTDHFLAKFHKYVAAKAPSDTAMVKLFVSDHWSGYEDIDVPYFILFFIVSTALFTILFVRRQVPGRFRAFIYACIVSGMIIGLALLITKQELLKLRYVGLHSSISLVETNVRASTVATAYPRDRVYSIRTYLQRELDQGYRMGDAGGYDLDFSQFSWAKQEGKVLRTYPSLVQHMGLKSSSKNEDSATQLYKNLAQDSSFVINYDSLIDDDYGGDNLPIHV